MSEMQIKKTDNRGSITIEMSIIMPILIIFISIFVSAFVSLADREAVRAGVYSAIYTMPLQGLYSEEKLEADINDSMISEEVQIMCAPISGDSISMMCALGPEGDATAVFTCKKENDVCTDRLRRWQLYRSLGDEYLPD